MKRGFFSKLARGEITLGVPFILALLAFRLVWAWLAQIPLTGDEAYYWDWGRRPDWGYYSKPPMIGWIMALAAGAGMDSALGIRLLAAALGTLPLLPARWLARQLFGDRAANLAVLFMALCPAGIGLSVFLTIDLPLLACWIVSLALYWRALRPGAGWGWWLALGLVLGAGHLSKQMMWVFPLLMILHAGLEQRRRLRDPRFWTSIALGFLLLAPFFWWNVQHDWITAKHTAEHFHADSPTLGRRLGWLGGFIGSQMALYTPLPWIALGLALAAVARRWSEQPEGARFLATFSLPGLLVFHLLSLRQEINPNWPAAHVLAGLILAAAAFSGRLPGIPPWITRTRRPAAIFVLALAALALVALPLARLAGERLPPELDPYQRMRGWKELALAAEPLLQGAPRPEETFLLALGHRYSASQLAFHMPSRPRVYRWERDGQARSQYEVWPSAAERTGWDALVLYPERGAEKEPPRSLQRAFESFDKIAEIEAYPGSERFFQVWLGRSLLQWPDPPPASAAETAAPSPE